MWDNTRNYKLKTHCQSIRISKSWNLNFEKVPTPWSPKIGHHDPPLHFRRQAKPPSWERLPSCRWGGQVEGKPPDHPERDEANHKPPDQRVQTKIRKKALLCGWGPQRGMWFFLISIPDFFLESCEYHKSHPPSRIFIVTIFWRCWHVVLYLTRYLQSIYLHRIVGLRDGFSFRRIIW